MMNPDIIAAFTYMLVLVMTLPVGIAIVARTIRQAAGELYSS